MFTKQFSFVGLGLVLAATGCGGPVDSGDSAEADAVTDDPSSVGTVSEAAVTGQRPLLVVLMKRADNKALAHTWSWYQDRIFGRDGGRNVSSYYSALSGNRFTFTKASVLSVKDPETAAFDTRAGVTAADTDGAVIHGKRGRLLAADAGFDYSAFDTNGDGRVDTNELAILVIDKYSVALGANRSLGCWSLSGVNVCSRGAMAGHRSGLMNYAHELSHSLSPISVDLYGAANNNSPRTVPCYSSNMTLLSCTASTVADDGTGAYFMDPWHRGADYGWITLSSHVTLSGVNSGSQLLQPAGFGASGVSEMLEVHGPNSESVIFEYRATGANEYDDAVGTSGVVAWYRKAQANGQPADIASIQPNTTDNDKALFTLAPVSCRLNPGSTSSRGKVAPLTSGSYRVTWGSGSDSGFLFTITPGFLSYTVSYSRTGTAPSC